MSLPPPDLSPPHAVYEFTKVSPPERIWKQQYSTKLYWEKNFRQRKQPEITKAQQPFRFFDLPLELRDAVYSFLDLPDHVTYTHHHNVNLDAEVRSRGRWRDLIATKRRLHNSANDLQRDCMSMKMTMPHKLPVYTKWEPDMAWAFPSMYQDIVDSAAAFAVDGLDQALDEAAQRKLQKIVDDAVLAQQHLDRYSALLKAGSPQMVSHSLRSEVIAFFKRTCLVQLDMSLGHSPVKLSVAMDTSIALWKLEIQSSWHHLHAISLRTSFLKHGFHEEEERYSKLLTVLDSLKAVEHIEVELTGPETSSRVSTMHLPQRATGWTADSERKRWLSPIIQVKNYATLRSVRIDFHHGVYGNCSIEAKKSKIENSREWIAWVRKEEDLFAQIVTFTV